MVEVTLSQRDDGIWMLRSTGERGAEYTELFDTFDEGLERIKELML